MAKQKMDAAVNETAEKTAEMQKFNKRQVLASCRYQDRKDLVSALLDDGREYTIAEIDQMINGFMKGKVK